MSCSGTHWLMYHSGNRTQISHTKGTCHSHCAITTHSTARDRKALQRVIKTAQLICGGAFSSLQDMYITRVIRRTHNIIKDNTHPQHSLFTLLPSGRRHRSMKARTTRLTTSFYPQAIRLLDTEISPTHTPSSLPEH